MDLPDLNFRPGKVVEATILREYGILTSSTFGMVEALIMFQNSDASVLKNKRHGQRSQGSHLLLLPQFRYVRRSPELILYRYAIVV